ncbi:MAG: hypothetical protein IKE41_03405, partial [Clostridia bacterium]|nr:hypothetical protein [Clostridia bacterium]MBR2735538.1 hypothetical protein [Clostridia bacterium]
MPFGFQKPRKNPGNKTTDIKQSSNDQLTAKREEKSSKVSVFKTFKNAYQRIKTPFIKSVIQATTPEQLEIALASRKTKSITERNPIVIALLYVKSIQLFGTKGAQVVLKGNPQEAAAQLTKLANRLNEKIGFVIKKYKYTYKKLQALAERIKTINSHLWGALIKFFDASFESKMGSAMLSSLLNVKNIGSNQKLLNYITNNVKPVAPTNEGIWWDDLKQKKEVERRNRQEKAKN